MIAMLAEPPRSIEERLDQLELIQDDTRGIARTTHEHVQSIYDRLFAVEGKIDKIGSNVVQLKLSTALLEKQMTEMAGRMSTVERRLDGLDQRLDGVDQRLDGLDQRLDGLDQRLDGVDQRLGTIEAATQTTAVAVTLIAQHMGITGIPGVHPSPN